MKFSNTNHEATFSRLSNIASILATKHGVSGAPPVSLSVNSDVWDGHIKLWINELANGRDSLRLHLGRSVERVRVRSVE